MSILKLFTYTVPYFTTMLRNKGFQDARKNFQKDKLFEKAIQICVSSENCSLYSECDLEFVSKRPH